MNHTSPLADVSAMADFWLTRVLARVAVPFFLMTTGYFLSRNHWAGVGRQLKKLCLLYGVCILLYLPVNLYAGSFTGPADVLRNCWWTAPSTTCGISRRPFWASSSPGGSAGWAAGGSACGGATLSHRSGRGQLLWTGFPDPAASDPLRRHFYTVRLYPQWPVLRATVPSAWGRPEGGGTKSCLWRASSSLWQP